VAARTREIATLRALGSAAAGVLSVLLESWWWRWPAAASRAAWRTCRFDGYRAATMNWQSSAGGVRVRRHTRLLLKGVLYAVAIGLVGRLFLPFAPARLPVVAALREM